MDGWLLFLLGRLLVGVFSGSAVGSLVFFGGLAVCWLMFFWVSGW